MSSFSDWIVNNWIPLTIIGTIIVFIVRTSVFFTRTRIDIKDFLDESKEARGTLDKVATNHLPHLQQGIDDVKESLVELHEGLSVLNIKISELKAPLENIDKNMSGLRDDLRLLLFNRDRD